MKRTRTLGGLFCACMLVSATTAALLAGDQEARRLEVEVRRTISLEYLLYEPERDEGEKKPLLVFLHGAGERGDDLERVKVHGPPKRIAAGKEFPFFVASPQCPRRERWGADMVVGLVDHLVATLPVDPDRVYLTGLSMGGFGTWSTVAEYPDRFAAIAPICGGGDPESVGNFHHLPVWAFHGAKDSVVPLQRSQAMVDALEAYGASPRLTVYPEAAHDSWTATYDNPEFYTWLLKHRRSSQELEIPQVEPGVVDVDADALAAADAAVKEFVEEGEIAGAVVIAARRGAIFHAKAHGKRDLENELPMKLDTIFRIYSMTKPVTSVAVLMLVEEGKIDLDAPVSRYVPQLEGLGVYVSGEGEDIKTRKPRREMTTRDLLRHTSGLTYGFFGDTPVDRLYRESPPVGAKTLEAMVEQLGAMPLLYDPGEQWVYSVSVDVLGRVVESVSGKPFDRFLRERIFRPLGMKDTGFHVPEKSRSRFAVNYRPGEDGGLDAIDEGPASRYLSPPTLPSGGGGLVSTARDYLRFCQMLLNGGELGKVRILHEETTRAMARNQLPSEIAAISFGPAVREGVGFGLGVSVVTGQSPANPGARVGEFGWGGAASTHFWIDPQEELIVIALSQFMPYSDRLERALKPVFYEAIRDED